MSIYYVLVAKRNDMILVDYTEYSGNFQQITIDLMKRIEPETKKTFELSDYLFHYINEEGLTVLCMTAKETSKKLAFSFLADVRKRLYDFYSPHELQNAKAFGLKTFGSELKEKVHYYNKNPIISSDKSDELLKDLNGLKDVMVENLDKLLQRDGKIEIIASKAEQLSTSSNTYRKNVIHLNSHGIRPAKLG